MVEAQRGVRQTVAIEVAADVAVGRGLAHDVVQVAPLVGRVARVALLLRLVGAISFQCTS